MHTSADLLETSEYFDRTYWGSDRSDPVMVYDLYEVGCDHCKHIEIKNSMGGASGGINSYTHPKGVRGVPCVSLCTLWQLHRGYLCRPLLAGGTALCTLCTLKIPIYISLYIALFFFLFI